MAGRQVPSLTREREAWTRGRLLIGVDEVGRGPLAGPVVAAAVVFLEETPRIRGVRDSKVLPPARRAVLAAAIRSRAHALGLGAASPREIDRWNIRRATALAMRRALAQLRQRLPASAEADVLIDGLPMPELASPHEALVDGDALCYTIAAAGILAKTVRDRLMESLDTRYAPFGWGANRGYGTPEHLDALRRLGPTRHHRATFAPVIELQLGL